jgi:transcriptional regulator with XRE-family HTH domain
MRSAGTPGGKRLKALRENVGKTQLEVELDASLGTGYLQRVESGKVKHPERDTLERIVGALNARYTERRDILESFGYIVDAPPPNADEIQWAIKLCRAELDAAVFPAYLLDCTHSVLAWNAGFLKLFSIERYLNSAPLSMLRVLFDPAYGVTPNIANSDEFFPASIRALRSEMQLFHGEAWYERLVTEMRTDCPVFERYWIPSEAQGYSIAARPLTPLEIRSDGEVLKFRITSEPFIQDRRFRVIYCIPADAATMQTSLGWIQAAPL